MPSCFLTCNEQDCALKGCLLYAFLPNPSLQHSRSPSPVFLELDPKGQERHLFWYIQLKGNGTASLC